jgi:hypothetical protein
LPNPLKNLYRFLLVAVKKAKPERLDPKESKGKKAIPGQPEPRALSGRLGLKATKEIKGTPEKLLRSQGRRVIKAIPEILGQQGQLRQ